VIGPRPHCPRTKATPTVAFLSVAKAGSGGGTVARESGEIDCGTSCAASFSEGTVLTLTATPDASSTFAGWSGACSGTGECVVTMDSAKSVTATFAKITFPLTTTKNGGGTGTITSTPAGISCGATCAAAYDIGTVVSLTAVEGPSSIFIGWSGACTGFADCVVTMDAARHVGALFIPN
jgi:hypothetical protein